MPKYCKLSKRICELEQEVSLLRKKIKDMKESCIVKEAVNNNHTKIHYNEGCIRKLNFDVCRILQFLGPNLPNDVPPLTGIPLITPFPDCETTVENPISCECLPSEIIILTPTPRD